MRLQMKPRSCKRCLRKTEYNSEKLEETHYFLVTCHSCLFGYSINYKYPSRHPYIITNLSTAPKLKKKLLITKRNVRTFNDDLSHAIQSRHAISRHYNRLEIVCKHPKWRYQHPLLIKISFHQKKLTFLGVLCQRCNITLLAAWIYLDLQKLQ